jgi:hypothetical protein
MSFAEWPIQNITFVFGLAWSFILQVEHEFWCLRKVGIEGISFIITYFFFFLVTSSAHFSKLFLAAGGTSSSSWNCVKCT